MSTFSSFKYYINNTAGKVEGNTTLDLNQYYTSTMTKADVIDLNGTMVYSYFGDGNLKDSKVSEALMCTIFGANSTNVIGKQDACFHDGKIQHKDRTEYISMKASRRANSFNYVMNQTPLKLYQFFNMTSGKIELDDVATNWAMTNSSGIVANKSVEYLSKLLDNQEYCDKICSLYAYVPDGFNVYSIATSYPGKDGLVYVEKTDAISSQRMFVAGVTISSLKLHGTEDRMSALATKAVFGVPTTTVGIKLFDPEAEAGKFSVMRDELIQKLTAINDLGILETITNLLEDLNNL